MILDENTRIAEAIEKLADGQIVLTCGDLLLGPTKEAQDVTDQLPVLGADNIAPLAEQAIEVFTEYSRRPSPMETAKLIQDGAIGTVRCSKNAVRLG